MGWPELAGVAEAGVGLVGAGFGAAAGPGAGLTVEAGAGEEVGEGAAASTVALSKPTGRWRGISVLLAPLVFALVAARADAGQAASSAKKARERVIAWANRSRALKRWVFPRIELFGRDARPRWQSRKKTKSRDTESEQARHLGKGERRGAVPHVTAEHPLS